MPSLAAAALSPAERRALKRLTHMLEAELGPQLEAVWLYGSRARGEGGGSDSDIDVMVATAGGRARDGDRVEALARAAADAEGASLTRFSPQVVDAHWIRGRRSIESFYMREVDRDKIVLAGDDALARPGEEPPPPAATGMKPRSAESLGRAHDSMAWARQTLEGELPGLAVSPAYYAMLHAAHAALSEEDLYAKTHSGTWTLLRRAFVLTGRLDAGLAASAEQAQRVREQSDYGGVRVTPSEATAAVRSAERFVVAMEELIPSRR